jgi:hypothetical protein
LYREAPPALVAKTDFKKNGYLDQSSWHDLSEVGQGFTFDAALNRVCVQTGESTADTALM